MATALDGIRVLDLSRLFPGPLCTMFLADLGADVLKVEDPVQGDYMRWLPPYAGRYGAQFMALNRNKRSMKLNLKAEKGRDIFLRLVEGFDVVVESFRPGVMDRLGVGYEEARARNPRIIYCAVTGYGQDGPYRDKPGHDINYAGYAGAVGLTGPPGGAPVVPGVQVADVGGGALMAAIGILAALIARERTGTGQFVDVSMMDGVVAWLALYAAAMFAGEPAPDRGTHTLTGGSPVYQVYETKDRKYVTTGNLEPKFWKELCRLVGREDLADSQFEEGAGRERVFAIMREIFRTRTRDEWMDFFEGKDVCVGPVNTLEEALADPQIVSRGMVVELDHPGGGKMKHVRNPVKLSGTPPVVRAAAPGFGEHTAEVLGEIGIGGDEVEALRKENVV
ncbi:MAG: CoA transferase [bacterium]